MKKLIFIVFATLAGLSVQAQNEYHLNEVKIIASRTTKNAEGYITHLRGSDLTKGKPTTELLSLLPNISREDNNFKINGLAVSEVYIDGVRLSDLSELDNIPGTMIDKVQVRYLAGSEQNAALSGGTIMITLRRPAEGGYYGSINVNAAWQHSCGFGNESIGGLINYRYKNLSIYDNLYVGATESGDNSEQSVLGPDLTTLLAETSKSHGFDFRNRLSLTQQFNSGAQLGGSYLIASDRPRLSSVTIGDNSASSITNRINALTQEGTLKLSLPLNDKGAAMELTADYFNRHSDEYSLYYSDGENDAGIREASSLNLWMFKADFLHPHNLKLAWKFGASAQLISAAYAPSSILKDDRFITSSVPTRTKGFTPMIYAAAQGTVSKLRYSAGVNWQLNNIEYEDLNANAKNHNTQWSINPTVQIMMPFGAQTDHAFMLNYKRTLNDIPYSAISSVINWSDSYNYSVGNPDLKAQSADMVMAAVSLFRNKLNFTALYAYAHDRIYWQTFQNPGIPDVFYTKPVNISGQSIWGFGAEWMPSPLKWWSFKLSGRIEITPEDLTLGGVHYDKTRFREYFYFNNNFTFAYGWGGMLNADFEPTFHNLDRTYHAVYNVSGRIYKTFLHDNLQVTLNFTAWGNRRELDRRTANNLVSYKYTTPVQSVGFSVVWNFSGGKKVNVNVVEGIQGYHETKDAK